MRESTHLPDLRILSITELRLHESCDERRVAALNQRLLAEGRLKNPPIVTQMPENQGYMVLDGANRVSALRQLGVPHIVVQVVSYDDPGVVLSTWHHVVAGFPGEAFAAALDAVPNLQREVTNLERARRALAIGDAVAYIVRPDEVYLVCHQEGSGGDGIHLLNGLVGAYKGKADIFRASNDDFEKQAPMYPDITALVIFPGYRPADLIALVRQGDVVPSGITRHIIPERALRINIPLSLLASDQSLAEKEDWMRQWWRARLDTNAIRFYAESTFLFDE